MLHRHLLEKKIGLRVGEGGEEAASAKVHPDGLEPLAQASVDVEDKGAVGDDLAQVNKHVLCALHLPAVFGDRLPWTKLRNFASRSRVRVSLLLRNWDSTASQATWDVESCAEMEVARSFVMMPVIHDLTTQSMHCQSGNEGPGDLARRDLAVSTS